MSNHVLVPLTAVPTSALYDWMASEFSCVDGAARFVSKRFDGELCSSARLMAYHASRVLEGYDRDPLEDERTVLGRSSAPEGLVGVGNDQVPATARAALRMTDGVGSLQPAR